MTPKVPIAISASLKVVDVRVFAKSVFAKSVFAKSVLAKSVLAGNILAGNILASRILAGSPEAIADAADGMDQRIGLLVVDLAAHPPDIDVDDVGRRIEVQIPDVLQQHRARHHTALVAHQIFQQLKLLRQQHQLLAAPARTARDQIDREITDPQDGFLGDRIAAPEQRLEPRQQLDKGKRLDQIIVAAGAQAANAIVDLAERADDQERHRDAVVPQLAHHSDAVNIGQHAVDRDHAIVAGRGVAQRLAACGREVDQIAAARELLGELTSGFWIVLDHQNAAMTSCHDLSRKQCSWTLGPPPAYGMDEANTPAAIITMMWLRRISRQ